MKFLKTKIIVGDDITEFGSIFDKEIKYHINAEPLRLINP